MRLRARLASPAMSASAILACACSVSRAMAGPSFCQSGEYSWATWLNTSTNSSSPAFRLMPATSACSPRGSLPGTTGSPSAKRRNAVRSASSVRSAAN